MGQHYNSVRRGDDPLDEGKSQITDYPIGADLDHLKRLFEEKQLVM